MKDKLYKLALKRRAMLFEMLKARFDELEPKRQHQIYGAIREIDYLIGKIEEI